MYIIQVLIYLSDSAMVLFGGGPIPKDQGSDAEEEGSEGFDRPLIIGCEVTSPYMVDDLLRDTYRGLPPAR